MAQPKMLHAWQAYQVLTYESQWKMEVDKEWKEYKIKWESEHPGEDPLKGRFMIMNKFMREKYTSKEESVDDNVKKRKGPSENAKRRERNVEKPKGPSEYTKRRKKNIKENKKILAELKKKH